MGESTENSKDECIQTATTTGATPLMEAPPPSTALSRALQSPLTIYALSHSGLSHPGCTSSVGEAQGAEVICSSVTARSQPHRFSNPPCPSSHNISEWTELGKTSAPVTPKHFTKEANKAQRWKGSLIASTSLWQVAGVRVSEGTDCCFVPVISSKWNSLRGGGGYGINNSDQGGSWKRGFCSSLSEAFPGVIWGTARGSLLYPVAGLLSFGCSWGWFSNRGQTSHPKVPSLTLDFAFPPVKGPLLP